MPLMTARTGSITFYNTALMTDERASALGRLVVVMGGLAFVASLLGFAWAYRSGGRLGADAGPWDASRAIVPMFVDVALFTIFALHHSLLARTGWRSRRGLLLVRGGGALLLSARHRLRGVRNEVGLRLDDAELLRQMLTIFCGRHRPLASLRREATPAAGSVTRVRVLLGGGDTR